LIRIERDRTDEHGRPIRPDDAWFEKAKDGRALGACAAGVEERAPPLASGDFGKAVTGGEGAFPTSWAVQRRRPGGYVTFIPAYCHPMRGLI